MNKDQNEIEEKKQKYNGSEQSFINKVNDVVLKCDVTRPFPKKSESWTCRERMDVPFL